MVKWPWRRHSPATVTPRQAADTPDTQCARHSKWAVSYCHICGEALCLACDPGLTARCRKHRRH